MGVYNAFSLLGGVVAYPLVGISIMKFGWRAAFIIPPMLLLLWAVVYSQKCKKFASGLRI